MKATTVNLNYLRELAAGDTKFMTEMITLFLKQTPLNVNALTSYLQEQDWENLKKLAHKMTSGVALMGIQDLQNFLAELQTYPNKQINTELLPGKISELKEIYQQAASELSKELSGLTRSNYS